MTKFLIGTAFTALTMLSLTAVAEDARTPDAKSLDGAWTVVCYEKAGQAQAEAKGMTVKAEAGTITCEGKDGKGAMTLKVAFSPNGVVQMTEAGTDAAAPAAAAKAGVYVLTADYLAISLNPETAGGNGPAGKSQCSIILKRDAAT